MRKTLLLAAALVAAPALAQDTNNTAGADANTVTAAPDANAVDANAMNADANAVAPLPPPATEPVATDVAAAPEPAEDGDDIPWGLVGLVGLIGLLGRKRS